MSNESVNTTELCLWTVWADSFATGEGHTILGLICSALSPQDARERFGEVFDLCNVSGCDAEKGAPRASPGRPVLPPLCRAIGALLRWIT